MSTRSMFLSLALSFCLVAPGLAGATETPTAENTVVVTLNDDQMKLLQSEDSSDAVAIKLTDDQRSQIGARSGDAGPKSVRLTIAHVRSKKRVAVLVNQGAEAKQRFKVLPASVALPAELNQ